ncbi:MAG: 23S rRNA (uridine(2552)-2'-O)-methyltransferase RlmE [Xanthomonadales bacterium]|nr:23S rRNA (uridine(2552)-2'-O)-methyltransferase RlmE [Xanthomonadales bacterium]
MGRSKSSKRWLKEHFSDPYVQEAQAEGWRSRAVFKLKELQNKYTLLKPGMTVVDLGAAPGGWSQLAAQLVGSRGRVIALDILAMDPLDEVTFIQGDFTETPALEALEAALDGQPVDVVLSDMAPNITGMKAADQPRAMYLAELALDFARQWVRPGGAMLAKVFQGEGFDAFIAQARAQFSAVKTVKPKASRSRSREVYVMARGRRTE